MKAKIDSDLIEERLEYKFHCIAVRIVSMLTFASMMTITSVAGYVFRTPVIGPHPFTIFFIFAVLGQLALYCIAIFEMMMKIEFIIKYKWHKELCIMDYDEDD